MKRILFLLLALVGTFSASCSGTSEIAMDGDYIIEIKPGEEWLHDFSRFIKTPPQYALWIEDETGNYQGTVFLTRKIATEGWTFNKGNRRIESLPVWAHKRNIIDGSGVLLPSKDEPFTDGVTGATPKGESEIVLSPVDGEPGFWIFLEVNQSTDFNSYWPKEARPGESQWTGGEEGSGQPSLVYKGWIDPLEAGPWSLFLAGHGSPDGSDGLIYEDVSSFTTALNIIGSVTIEVLP